MIGSFDGEGGEGKVPMGGKEDVSERGMVCMFSSLYSC